MAKYPQQYSVLTTTEINTYPGVCDPAFMIKDQPVQTSTIASLETLCESNPAWALLKWQYIRTSGEELISVFHCKSSDEEIAAAIHCYTEDGLTIELADVGGRDDAVLVPKGVRWDFHAI
jgi:hypothetical protein